MGALVDLIVSEYSIASVKFWPNGRRTMFPNTAACRDNVIKLPQVKFESKPAMLQSDF